MKKRGNRGLSVLLFSVRALRSGINRVIDKRGQSCPSVVRVPRGGILVWSVLGMHDTPASAEYATYHCLRDKVGFCSAHWCPSAGFLWRHEFDPFRNKEWFGSLVWAGEVQNMQKFS